jgi:hypothetical protein
MNTQDPLDGTATGPPLKPSSLWPRILVVAGILAMLAGAVDPLEGSPLILLGSGLAAFGAYFDSRERRWFAYRLGVFALVAVGFGAMWGLSSVGGFGGNSGRSMWWGVLILPMFAGWCLGVCGPGQPRWLLVPGIVVSLWYLALPTFVLGHGKPAKDIFVTPAIVLGVTGLLTLGGCIWRLFRRTGSSSQSPLASHDVPSPK